MISLIQISAVWLILQETPTKYASERNSSTHLVLFFSVKSKVKGHLTLKLSFADSPPSENREEQQEEVGRSLWLDNVSEGVFH